MVRLLAPLARMGVLIVSVSPSASVRITISLPAAVVTIPVPPEIAAAFPPDFKSPLKLSVCPPASVMLKLPGALIVFTAAVVCAVMSPEICTFCVASSTPSVAPPAIVAGAFASVP